MQTSLDKRYTKAKELDYWSLDEPGQENQYVSYIDSHITVNLEDIRDTLHHVYYSLTVMQETYDRGEFTTLTHPPSKIDAPRWVIDDETRRIERTRNDVLNAHETLKELNQQIYDFDITMEEMSGAQSVAEAEAGQATAKLQLLLDGIEDILDDDAYELSDRIVERVKKYIRDNIGDLGDYS